MGYFISLGYPAGVGVGGVDTSGTLSAFWVVEYSGLVETQQPKADSIPSGHSICHHNPSALIPNKRTVWSKPNAESG
jgi:hypothetical protein